MNNFLEEYLKQQHLDSIITEVAPGPVLTLSREFGCEAQPISKQLVNTLNIYHRGIGQSEKWDIISKEILDESARELQTDSKKIEYLFSFEKRTSIDDFLMSMTTRYYQSDWKVRETIKKVVHAYAVKGYSIIVGRAGAQIAKDIQNALHVKIIASFDWRVNRIKEKFQLPEKDAVKKVKEMDENRKRLIEQFSSKEKCDYCYDVIYNLENLTIEMIVSDIIHLMQLKKMI